jgi:hypothetical protein
MIENHPEPRNLPGLFTFYQDFVKLLYSRVQTENELPQEVLFELNAALDHISRIYVYEEDEARAVEKAYSHLKRSCLDIFKLKVKETKDHWDELRRAGIEVIDNGEFKRDAIALMAEIRKQAREARWLEGDRRNDDDAVAAFERWIPVYRDCERFEEEFYANKKVEWARSQNLRRRVTDWGTGIGIGVIGSLIASALWSWFTG